MSLQFGQIDLLSAIWKWLDKKGVPHLNCRQTNATIEAANIILAALERKHIPASEAKGLTEWLGCDEVGASSLYMASVLAPLAGLGSPRCRIASQEPWPHDGADFGRCVGLLDSVPELRAHLPALAEGHGDVWDRLVAKWDELELAYRRATSGDRSEAERLHKAIQEAKGVSP